MGLRFICGFSVLWPGVCCHCPRLMYLIDIFLFPSVACHKPYETLIVPSLMKLAIKITHTVNSYLNSVTVPFSSSSSGATKVTAEQMGHSGIDGYALASFSRMSQRWAHSVI